MTAGATFSKQLLHWYREYGRKDLPWQGHDDPYPIWVSEIMLQQTQVSTVIPYYNRFVTRFPSIQSLASATEDEVLSYWSGLGYYSRARNLHKAAIQIRERHGGYFPDSPAEAMALSGIGRSTAAAILAFAFGRRLPILDGNVKRVLTRYHGIQGWPGQKDIEKKLWDLAGQHTPESNVREYTQAIMDLGATVCTRRPACEHCPIGKECVAHSEGKQADYPTRRPRKSLPVKRASFLIVRDKSAVLLQKRPPTGVWANLWCLPEIDTDAADFARDTLGMEIETPAALPSFRHTFSHYHLDIQPVATELKAYTGRVMEGTKTVWYNLTDGHKFGMPAPVSKLLKEIL